MSSSELVRFAPTCLAAAMLTACGVLRQVQDDMQPPIGAPGAMPRSSALQSQRAQRARSGSWMLPEAKGADLLYVSGTSFISVYTYPQGKLVGKLKGFYLASGQCVDSAGSVYITDYGNSAVYKYAHGSSKRLRTYFVPNAIDCSIDPQSGDLAVASWGDQGVWIFKSAKGAPLNYTDSHFYGYYSCGYDSKGDLFTDGISRPGSGNVVLAELLKDDTHLRMVSVGQYLFWPTGVKWDGKHLAVGDGSSAVYQFVIRRRKATTVGTTHLGSGASSLQQFWVQGQTLLISTSCSPECHGTRSNQAVMFFKYPAGGRATKILTAGLSGPPEGDSVSLAPSH